MKAQNPNQPIIPKYLSFLLMLYFASPLATMILVHKEMSFWGYTVSVASFLSPLWFLVNDIITEVYGYSVARNAFWSWGIAGLIISFILNTMSYLPSPSIDSSTAPYQIVFGHLFRQVLDAWLAMACAAFINIYLISKWKIFLKGKYFWLRSFGASVISTIVLETVFEIGLIGTFPVNTLISMGIFGIVTKVLIIFMLAFPGNLITYLLKKFERLDVYDYGINFNPFKLNTGK